MSIRIEVENNQKEFEPGDSISGKVFWDLTKEPKRVSVNLLWYTDGKGSEDLEVVDSMEIESFNFRGSKGFTFVLPDEPYSFSGTLISICWTLEAFAKKSKDKDQYELVVAPNGKEVRL